MAGTKLSSRVPISRLTSAMIGKVSGLPKKVASSAARILPPIAQAIAVASTKCSPKNGVKQTNTPAATPRLIRCAGSGRRRMRWTT